MWDAMWDFRTEFQMALNSLRVKHAGPGRHADIDGLYLLVRESGTRSWVAIANIAGLPFPETIEFWESLAVDPFCYRWSEATAGGWTCLRLTLCSAFWGLGKRR